MTQVTITEKHPGGGAAFGTIEFELSEPCKNASNEVVLPRRRVVHLQGTGGSITLDDLDDLTSLDDVRTGYPALYYTAIRRIAGVSPNLANRVNVTGAGPVELGSLTQTTPAPWRGVDRIGA